MPEHIVTYEEWESCKVKLTDEIFQAIYSNDGKIMFYRGRESGTRLGLWFEEVLENPIDAITMAKMDVTNSISQLEV